MSPLTIIYFNKTYKTTKIMLCKRQIVVHIVVYIDNIIYKQYIIFKFKWNLILFKINQKNETHMRIVPNRF